MPSEDACPTENMYPVGPLLRTRNFRRDMLLRPGVAAGPNILLRPSEGTRPDEAAFQTRRAHANARQCVRTTMRHMHRVHVPFLLM